MLRILTLFLILTPIVSAAPPKPREPFEDAVDPGLVYLAKSQHQNGSWSAELGNARSPGDPALTALSVMAFMSAGHVPGEGKYGPVVERGIRFVLDSQQPNGLIALAEAGYVEMYSHGVCTLMLAEAAGMTDGKTADELKDKLVKAVKVILKAQRDSTRDAGGWRYQIIGFDADLSVTGWQLMALRAAHNLGCDVPQDRVKAAVEYTKKCHDPRSGGYAYTIGGNVTPACTGTGILSLELSGKEFHKTHEALRGGAYLLQHPPDLTQPHFFYGAYYTSQAMFQLGDNYWAEFRPKLHALLLKSIPQRANGAWYGRGFDDATYGPAYCTAMAVLALTVEYRFLPIYQRDEGEKGK
ncbi:MAG TPA: prenyltransferase/squalene oxidase repeat-containing protein [Gemmataceae bacterium]|nr:prenyltransferase/squalene oxidase repeat-containing protein [Gemmataceae bacterium]